MLDLDSTTLEKIADLRELCDGWQVQPEVYELLKIDWESGAVYYACQQTDLVASLAPPVSTIECKINPKSSPAHFFEIEGNSSLGDEEISIEIWDGGTRENAWAGKSVLEFGEISWSNGSISIPIPPC
jgi:hypothetical protein